MHVGGWEGSAMRDRFEASMDACEPTGAKEEEEEREEEGAELEEGAGPGRRFLVVNS